MNSTRPLITQLRKPSNCGELTKARKGDTCFARDFSRRLARVSEANEHQRTNEGSYRRREEPLEPSRDAYASLERQLDLPDVSIRSVWRLSPEMGASELAVGRALDRKSGMKYRPRVRPLGISALQLRPAQKSTTSQSTGCALFCVRWP